MKKNMTFPIDKNKRSVILIKSQNYYDNNKII
jgi:hypothetical protein